MTRPAGFPTDARSSDFSGFRLEDRYRLAEGTVYLTGLQAVARAVVDSARREARAGRRIGTFISGYPGSPVGGMEGVFRSLGPLLEELDITLRPGVNEELAATSVLGATKRSVFVPGEVGGVTGVWYGKCNGVDRCVDVFKYGNYGGMGPNDAVVVLAGDDANVKSSGIPGESEHTLAAAGIPVLAPASVADVHDLFLHAVEMSRLSGCWVGLKLATDLCDGGATVDVGPSRPAILTPELPEDFSKYDTHFYFGGPILDGEESLYGVRHEAVRRYARANGLDRAVVSGDGDRAAVVAAGKTFTDAMQAFADLGIDAAGLRRAGIRMIKVGMVYPLDTAGVVGLVHGVERVVVIEEKRGIVEQQLRAALYELDDRPIVVGKQDELGRPLVPVRGELDADALRPILSRLFGIRDAARELIPVADATPVRRTPNYCSGCPHSRATVTPAGETVLGGIGCHSIGLFLTQPERRYEYNVQMGGEGAPWIGAAPFVGTRHIVQNLGDGTFYHSASQAVRACVEAGVDITFRLLFNGHIAMTGGQDIPGTRGVAALTRELEAMGVGGIAVVTDRRRELRRAGVRGRLVAEQDLQSAVSDLSAEPGVTVLIHDRECALERRRRWRHGGAAPRERLLIHERVCEGCGDCGSKSNCPSLEPVETEYGRKTRIQQSSCAVDRACLAGDCPSFVGVSTRVPIQPGRRTPPQLDGSEIPPPVVHPATALYGIGIGGTGVSTATAILAQAALMEGLAAVALDQTGLAQKGGPIGTHLITAPDAASLHANKVSRGRADVLLAFDLIEAAQPASLSLADPRKTALVVDTSITPTGEMIRDVWSRQPDEAELVARLGSVTREDARVLIPARRLAESLFGDHIKANLIAVGAASQAGFLPVGPEAIEAAIRLNGVDVEDNVLAYRYGRRWVVDEAAVERAAMPPRHEPAAQLSEAEAAWLSGALAKVDLPAELQALVNARAADLVHYQSRSWATGYLSFVGEVAAAERARMNGPGDLTQAVARHLHKLMAYKDEYEVARLLLDTAWRGKLRDEFGEDARLTYYLHPPLLRTLGLRRKLRLGPWFTGVLRLLRAARRLRGSPVDPFGRAEVRRLERSLPDWYRDLIRNALSLDPDGTAKALRVATLPDGIRGYESIKLANAHRVMAEADRILAGP